MNCQIVKGVRNYNTHRCVIKIYENLHGEMYRSQIVREQVVRNKHGVKSRGK